MTREQCSHGNAAPPCGCFVDQFSRRAAGAQAQRDEQRDAAQRWQQQRDRPTFLFPCVCCGALDDASHLDESADAGNVCPLKPCSGCGARGFEAHALTCALVDALVAQMEALDDEIVDAAIARRERAIAAHDLEQIDAAMLRNAI